MPFDGNPQHYEDPVLRTLLSAKRLVSNGWTQWSFARYGKRGVRYCLVGAIQYAATGRYNECRAKALLYTALPRWSASRWARRWIMLEDWNDFPWRRKKTVLRLFDKAMALHAEDPLEAVPYMAKAMQR